MTLPDDHLHRLKYLARVVGKEARRLQETDQRLFTTPYTPDRARVLDDNPDEADRVEAFVSRFGRLQDTLGDKLLPAFLVALGERVGAAIDNLDRAERLGYVESADTWMSARKLSNQMVHEYVEDPVVLANALQTGHDWVGMLTETAERMVREMERRGWV